MAGMGSDKVLMAGLVDAAITGDVIVVAGEAEAGGMAGYQGCYWEVLCAFRSTTMNDD